MKLKYNFDTVDMGDEIIAVPVGDDAEKIHGVVKLNKSGLEIMELLKEVISIDEIVEKLSSKYDNDRDEIKEDVIHIIDILKKAGIIDE